MVNLSVKLGLNRFKCVDQVGNNNNATCERCKSGCNQECAGAKIDSITTAELFRGCTHIKGTLEISLRTGGGEFF